MVSKTYRDGSVDRPVLCGVSVNFARGEMTSLTGVSGSGKSTLISMLAGLVLPDSGRVVFDGEDITEMDDAARAELRARRVRDRAPERKPDPVPHGSAERRARHGARRRR